MIWFDQVESEVLQLAEMVLVAINGGGCCNFYSSEAYEAGSDQGGTSFMKEVPRGLDKNKPLIV